MGTAAVNWSVDVTIELLNRDVNVFVYQNVNVSLSNRTHQGSDKPTTLRLPHWRGGWLLRRWIKQQQEIWWHDSTQDWSVLITRGVKNAVEMTARACREICRCHTPVHWCTLVSHWCSTPVVPHWCHNAGVHGVTLDFRAPASLTATAAPKRLHPAKKPGWHCCWWSVAHRAFIQLKKVHYKHQQISKSNGFPFLFWLGEKSFLRSSLSSGIRRDVCLFKTSSPSSTRLLLPPGTLCSRRCQSVFSQTWSVDPTCSSDTA